MSRDMTREEFESARHERYPRIVRRRGITLLEIDERVVMPIPSVDRMDAIAVFITHLSEDQGRLLRLAILKNLPDFQLRELIEFDDLMEGRHSVS